MRKSNFLTALTLLTAAAHPVAAQELPRVLFCMGQCFGIDEAGKRIPVAKGTQLAPGLRFETGPNSYAQVKFGPDGACGIGENARVRFDRRVADRDVVILDQGRIRMIGGEAIGRPEARAVELRTAEGNIVLRSADIEVKTPPRTADAPPAPMLVKLNVGEARLGELPVTKDMVQGIVGGKILDRAIPIGEIALSTPRQQAPSGSGSAAGTVARPPLSAVPVIDLPVTAPAPITSPVPVSPAIVSPALASSALAPLAVYSSGRSVVGVTPVYQPAIAPVIYSAIVPASTLILASPITTSTGTTTTLNTIATTIQTSQTTSMTIIAPLNTTVTLQPTFTTTTSTTPTLLSPRLTTTITR